MGNLLFWQRWPAPERIIFYLASLLFILTIMNLGYSYLTTPAPVIEFQHHVETRLTEVPYDSFRKGSFELTIPGNNYTITERLLGTPLEPNITANYIWLACFVLCITGLLAVVTTLSRYYYLASMGVFVLMVVSLKLETLLMFGRDDKAFTVATLIVFALCSFHIYYFLPSLKSAARLLYFVGATALTVLLVAFFSEAEQPALHVATYSVPAGMIAVVLFIVTVSHEIIAAFISILTQTTRQGKTLNHFLIITLIYMLNLVAAYAIRFRFLDWKIFYVDLFVLLIASGLLGLWGIRQRHKQMEGIVDMEPHGLIGYLLLGAMAFASIALFFGNANDPAYEAVSDVIIFSHLGYGLIFLFYVISNFGNMLSNNMAVHKVLYNPTSMPFFTFRLAGLIATLALTIFNTWQVPAHNAVAGYQNAVADLYLVEENNRVATVFYDQGRTYGFSNHRSNYALANMAGLKFDHDSEKGFYKSASYLRPTEMSYLNWAQMWQSEENNTEAIKVLKEGLQNFPKSGAIANSLGLLYAEDNVRDSAALYLQSVPTEYSQANLLALAVRNQLPLLADTTYRDGEPESLKGNKIAVASALGKTSQIPLSLSKDTSISVAQAAYLNNSIINRRGADTATLARIEGLSRREENSGLSEALLFATALGSYSAGDIGKAFRLLEEVAIVSTSKGKYNNILGLWCLEQDEPLRGLGYVEFALSQEYTAAVITNAVLLTEGLRYAPVDRSASIARVLAAWDSVKRIPDTTLLKLANRMTGILTATPGSVGTMSDEDKYAYARYRLLPWDTTAFTRIMSGVKDPNLITRGVLESSQLLLSYDDVEGATAMFGNVRGVRVTDTRLYDDLRLHERILLAAMHDVEGLRKLNESPLKLDGKQLVYKMHFDLLLADPGDTVLASKNYGALVQQSLFYDQGILDGAQFFASHGTDPLRAYTLLVEAVQHHPSSIRLRKAYIWEATRIGFEDFAAHALSELRPLIPEREYTKFAAEVGASQ